MLNKKLEDCKNGIFILGINNVNMSLAGIFAEKGIKTFLWDFDNKIINDRKNDFNSNELIDLLDINQCDFENIDYIILSKDIILDNNDSRTLLFRLEKIKEKVFLDIEFISELYPDNKYIVLLAPDYDFVVTTMMQNIFKYSNIKSINVEGTFNDVVEEDKKESNNTIIVNFNDIVCFSGVSDNRVNFIKNFKFDILAILDINEEIGKNKKLLKQRKNLISLQNESTIIFMNIDNKYIKKFYTEFIEDNNLKCKIIPISASKMLNDGVSYINNVIYNYYGNDNLSYNLKENDYFTSYVNRLSLLAAFMITKNCGVENDVILEALSSFNGIKNCLEYVSQYNNIKFINNVAANNDSILKSPFESYDNIYAIIIIDETKIDGGFNKKEQNNRKNVKKIYLVDYVGLIGGNVADNKKIFKYSNLTDAVNKAVEEIENEEDKENNITVLLSPMLADGENFIKYDKYGDEYKNIVASLFVENMNN